MDQETFNLSIRKFLKMVGVNSQREIEQAVQKAVQSGALKGDEAVPVKVTLDPSHRMLQHNAHLAGLEMSEA